MLNASNVIFFDDTQTTMGASRPEMEMPGPKPLLAGESLDCFLKARMNDETS